MLLFSPLFGLVSVHRVRHGGLRARHFGRGSQSVVKAAVFLVLTMLEGHSSQLQCAWSTPRSQDPLSNQGALMQGWCRDIAGKSRRRIGKRNKYRLQKHTCTCTAHMDAHTHTYMHTYIPVHTYIPTYLHTSIHPSLPPSIPSIHPSIHPTIHPCMSTKHHFWL